MQVRKAIICLQRFYIFSKTNIFAHLFTKGDRDVAQPGSVLAWGARGRWFESSHPDNTILPAAAGGIFCLN